MIYYPRVKVEVKMGLNFSHGDARWAYSEFKYFRRKLAKEIGIFLELMDGYTSFGISWDEVEDPIKPLLDHSDCEGALTPEECKSIAPRLMELIKNWEDDDDKLQALMMANGMLLAAHAGENFRFC